MKAAGTSGYSVTLGFLDDFFLPDWPNSMAPVIELKQVARVDGLWKLTLTGSYASNGNSAVLSLKDNYDTAGVELLPKVGGTSRLLPIGR